MHASRSDARARGAPARRRPALLPALLLGWLTLSAARAGCLHCHPAAARGHAPGHGFAATDCGPCHGGDPGAFETGPAHRGLVAFPGNLDNASRTCGTCHPQQLIGVVSGPMATLRGMVGTTRAAFGEAPLRDGGAGVDWLGDSPADSLLRRLCVSCHLGQPKTRHAHDAVRDRGGGCLACHANGYPADAHPELSARVRDERCFGCHSRSGRIALSYAGLGEVAAGDDHDGRGLGRLPDGRVVERLPADVHHQAGLGCVDCHTGPELMNLASVGATSGRDGGGGEPIREQARSHGLSAPAVAGEAGGGRDGVRRGDIGCADCHTGPELMSLDDLGATSGRDGGGGEPIREQARSHGLSAPAVAGEAGGGRDGVRRGDIGCADCHGPERVVRRAGELPPGVLARAPFALGPEQAVVVTARRGTPLWHLRAGADQVSVERKRGGGPVPVPPYRPAHHPLAGAHARLACEACHSQWAPQCYGCHIRFDPAGEQWDHLARGAAPGRWVETRWGTRNALPPLGVGAGGRVRPFVPGMVMTVEHPALGIPLFRRLFAPLSPHTTGPARGCETCHRAPEALGLGRGHLAREGGRWTFAPASPPLGDGLPADAWTSLSGGEEAGPAGGRPLAPAEVRRILEAELATPTRPEPADEGSGVSP